MRNINIDEKGRGRWKAGTAKAGKFASKAEIETEQLREAGIVTTRTGRYQYAKGTPRGGKFASKAAVAAARAEGAAGVKREINERVNRLWFNRQKGDGTGTSYADLKRRAVFGYTKGAWTGRNRPKDKADRTRLMLESAGVENMQQLEQKFSESESGRLFDAIINIDERTLINEFSGIADNMEDYIQYLRSISDDLEKLYNEAMKQTNIWENRYGRR